MHEYPAHLEMSCFMQGLLLSSPLAKVPCGSEGPQWLS